MNYTTHSHVLVGVFSRDVSRDVQGQRLGLLSHDIDYIIPVLYEFQTNNALQKLSKNLK